MLKRSSEQKKLSLSAQYVADDSPCARHMSFQACGVEFLTLPHIERIRSTRRLQLTAILVSATRE